MNQEPEIRTENPLGYAPLPTLLRRFAVPSIIAMLVSSLYNIVDQFFIGQGVGYLGNAATNVAYPLTTICLAIALLIGIGSASRFSLSLGEGNPERAAEAVGNAIGMMVLFGLAYAVVIQLFLEPLLTAFGATEDVMPYAVSYTRITGLGMPLLIITNAMSNLARADGSPKYSMACMLVGAVINTILDPICIFLLNWGVAGAAWATVISQGVSFLSCLVFLICRRKEYELNIGWGEFVFWDLPMLAELVSIGVPMAVKSAAVQASRLYVSAWVNSYGTAVSAFSGIAGKVSNTAIIISNSMSTAGASMVGQNLAAGKDRRVKQILKWVAVITISFAGLLSALMILFPRQIFGVFTAGGEPAVLALSGAYVPIAVLMFFGSGLRAVMNGFINGSGNHFVISVTAVMDGIVMRLGLAVLFGLVLDMKYVGFWLGDALAGFTPFWIGIIFYIKYFSGRQWADGGDEGA